MLGVQPSIRQVSRTRQVLGALTGVQTPTVQVVSPWLPWQFRVGRYALRLAGRMVRRACRRAWGRRRILAPFYLAMTLWLAAAIAHFVSRGWVTVAAVALLGVPVVWWRLGGWAWRFTRRRSLSPLPHRVWYAGAYAAAALWAVAAAGWRLGPPMPGLLLTGWLVCQVAWAWRHRTRPEPVVDDLGEVARTWARVKGMGKTTVHNVVELEEPRRVQFDVDLSGSDLLVKDVVAAIPYIAKPFKSPRTSVMADYAGRNLEDLARVEIVEDNPTHEKVVYDESWLPTAEDIAAGVVPYHLYPNGRRGKVRVWHPGAGTVMTLFSGDIGSGKSAGMSTLCTQQAMTGVVWPLAACPQGGASMPEWVGAEGQARWKAVGDEENLDPIHEQLDFLREAMHWRTGALSRLRWVDKWGDRQVGLGSWDPAITGWPALSWFGDEMWRLMLIPELAAVVKELLKLGRKAGIAMNGATQYPGIEEFNNDMALRQPLTAGNILSYRNTANTVKAMILPSHLPPPHEIPIETPEGEHTKGTLIVQSQAPRSSLPQYSRSVWVERGMLWARQAAERIPDLDPGTARILRKYRDAQQPLPQPEPQRETVTVTVAASRPAGRETYLDRIVAYLAGVDGSRAHSGVIAHDLDIPHPRVSEALKRDVRRTDSRVREVRPGVYGLIASESREMEEVAA